MLKNMESRPKAACPFTHNAPPLAEPDQAQYIRHHLNEFLERMVSGTLPLHLPPASSEGSEAAEWNDLKLSIGLVTRLIARWSCSTMLLRYLLWRTGIGTSRPALTASMAALFAPRLSIATFSRRPPKNQTLARAAYFSALYKWKIAMPPGKESSAEISCFKQYQMIANKPMISSW